MIGQEYREQILLMLQGSMFEIEVLEKEEAEMFQEPDRKVKLEDILYKSFLELEYGLNGKEQDKNALKALQDILIKEQHPGMLRRMGEKVLLVNRDNPDYEKAMRFFEPAAVRKDGIADYYCQVLYGVGFGSEPPHYYLSEYWDRANDLEWSSLVHYTPSAEMTVNLLHYEEYRHYLAKEQLFTAKKIQEYGDSGSALAYLLAAAIWGSPEGMYLYGRALSVGEGCTKDEPAALFWLEEAAKRGWTEAEELRDALRSRGISPRNPEKLPSDHELDETSLAKLIQAERSESSLELEPNPATQPKPRPQPKPEKPQRIQQQLQETEESKKREEELERRRRLRERQEAERAAALARLNLNPTAPEEQYQLATKYATGNIVDKDPWLAAEWLEKAAEQGHLKAQSELAFRYEYGDGVLRDAEKALKWYNRAALSGDRHAERAMGELLEELHNSKSSSTTKRSSASMVPQRRSLIAVFLFLFAAAIAWYTWQNSDTLYIARVGSPGIKYIGLCVGYALLMLTGSQMLYRHRTLFLSLILPCLSVAVFYFFIYPPVPVAIAGLYLFLEIVRLFRRKLARVSSSASHRTLIKEYRHTHKD